MVRYSASQAKGLKVIVGIEKATTEEVIEYALYAQTLGADGIMITTPFGESVTQQQMIAHFVEIHRQTTLKIWLYHETSLSNNSMSLETLLAVADLPRVVAIKDSGADLMVSEQIVTLIDKGVTVYNGWEDRMVAQRHDCGNIVSLSNLEPQICRQAAQTGDIEPRQSNINDLCEQYSLLAEDWYKFVKKALFDRGMITTALVVADQPHKE
jgi:4-hydroxy-tetrahydrodipicolinate synthase